MFPLLILPWVFAVHFLRKLLQQAPPSNGIELSIAEALRIALAANQAEQRHLKLVGLLFILFTPLLSSAIHHLHGIGKISHRELTSMATLFAGALLLGAIGISTRYFARVLPQQKRINSLLSGLAEVS